MAQQFDSYIRQFAEDVYKLIPQARSIRYDVARQRLENGEWVRLDQAVMDFVGLIHADKIRATESQKQIANSRLLK
jgi:hypothetical protein